MTDNNENTIVTLITGASMGIGKALALECAVRKMNLALIALPGQELDETVAFIRCEFNVKIFSLAIDLTEKDAPKRILAWCKENKLSVNMLINNAGMGCIGSLESYEEGFYETMIQLNIMALVSLTRLFLPELKTHHTAYILNLGSLAGFFAMPYKIVYASSKAFVYTFSRALKTELKGTSVHVAVICPGAVDTEKNIEINKKLGGVSKISRLSPQKVASIAICKTLQRKSVIIPGFFNNLYLSLSRLVPTPIKSGVIARVFKKGQKHR